MHVKTLERLKEAFLTCKESATGKPSEENPVKTKRKFVSTFKQDILFI